MKDPDYPQIRDELRAIHHKVNTTQSLVIALLTLAVIWLVAERYF